MLYFVIVLSCVASYPIIVVYGEWLNLAIISVGTWFYEHPYCTESEILFNFLMTNVITVSPFG